MFQNRFRPILERIEDRLTPATAMDPMAMTAQPPTGATMAQSAPAQPGDMGTTTTPTAPNATGNTGTSNNTSATTTGAPTNSTVSGTTLTASSGSGPSGATSTTGGQIGGSGTTFNYIGVNTFPLSGVGTGFFIIDNTGPVGSLSLAQASTTTATTQNGSYPSTPASGAQSGLPFGAIAGQGTVRASADQLSVTTGSSGSLFGPLNGSSGSAAPATAAPAAGAAAT